MNKTVRAFAPANISLLFGVVAASTPARTGSKGVGFTLDEGVEVSVSENDVHIIRYNGTHIDLPTVSMVVDGLSPKPMAIEITSPLPLGSGFGMSAAATLAAAYAVNKLLHLGHTAQALATMAHTAEVTNKTGLGDVINEYYGGFFVKFETSANFHAVRIPVKPIDVYCRSWGKLLTSDILSDEPRIIALNKEAGRALLRVRNLLDSQATVSFGAITDIANEFTENSGLLTSGVKSMIGRIKRQGGHASMILLGDAIVSDIPFEGAMKLRMGTKAACVVRE